MVGANTIIAILAFLFETSMFATPEMVNLLAVVIGIGTFAVSAILKDAYFSLHQNKKSFYIMGCAIILVMVFTILGQAKRGRIIEGGKLGDGSITAFVLLLWIVILLSVMIHSRKKSEEE